MNTMTYQELYNLLNDMLVQLDNYSSDLGLASNYGEFAESPNITDDRFHQIDELRDRINNAIEQRGGNEIWLEKN